jgi:hypothetical protein
VGARLQPGFSRGEVAAELALLASQQDRLHPERKTTHIVTDGSRLQRPDCSLEVVGVARDISTHRIGGPDDPTIYTPWFPQVPPGHNHCVGWIAAADGGCAGGLFAGAQSGAG